MNQDITAFYSAAVKNDFARQFQFALGQIGTTNFLKDEDLVYVETASLPGKQITNVPVPYMGLSFNVPGTVQYPGSAGYQLTFRCDQSYYIRSRLEESLRILFDDANSKGRYGIPGTNSQLSFHLMDKQRAIIRTYIMYGVWVQNLSDAAYNIGDTGTVVQIQATIAYQYWRVSSAGKANESDRAPFPS